MMKKGQKLLVLIFLAGAFGFFPLRAEARTIYNSPYVSFAPDGMAWTTDAGNRDIEWYREDGTDDVKTGIASALRPVGAGEHYYDVLRQGSVPVGEWRVVLSRVNCCHNGNPSEQGYHGISYVVQVCLQPHFSGWVPVCADCGRDLTRGILYLSRSAAKSIDHLEMRDGLDYYYLCPFNNNLEQGFPTERHVCKAISANRYLVEYLPNTQGEIYGGYMPPSYHIYGNAPEYEGRRVTPQKRLNRNSYHRIGWKFAGWNTRADGSGDFYADEAEVCNLCTGDYLQDKQQGTVQLYAMWERTSSTLEIDPAGGRYEGSAGVTAVTRDYGSAYEPRSSALEPPDGNRLSFDTLGGEPLGSVIGTRRFLSWKQEGETHGRWADGCYFFTGPDGNIERITAVYAYDPVELPLPHKENASFGGWYYDEEFAQPAGKAGDLIVPEHDLTLYAQWVELVLSSKENDTANGGKGAVDLSWTQRDGKNKVYKIYQSRDGKNWKLLRSAAELADSAQESRIFAYSGQKAEYKVPSSGFYALAAYGAQGGNYGSFTGGRGGEVKGRFWLQKGETLEIIVGGQNGYNGGGRSSKYANGGGYTSLRSKSRGLLAVAGGGGGAAPNGSGNAGGSAQSLVASGMNGEAGASGGGGGYLGGKAGELIVHNHVEGVCNHRHTGSADRYGGCYTQRILCGQTVEHEHTGTLKWKWGGYDEIHCPNCGADATKGEDCSGHETWYYTHTCPVHGRLGEEDEEPSKPESCYVVVAYAPACGRTEEYMCGYRAGEILSSKSAYGGSSYINSALAASYTQAAGVKTGNGSLQLTAQDVGYQSESRLDGVAAADEAPPEEVDAALIQKEAADDGWIRILWEKPSDRGTLYYHKAESYLTASAAILCTSNITADTLTTGVKGYYYCVDDKADTDPAAIAANFISSEEILLELPDVPSYFHIRAVDAAGNLSRTTHVYLGSRLQGDEDVAWPVFTRQLEVEAGENVYAASSPKTYFVRGDGRTPFGLRYEAYMQGIATPNYQIDHAVFQIAEDSGAQAQNEIVVPKGEIADNEIAVNADMLRYAAAGDCGLLFDSFTQAVRNRRCRDLILTQNFVAQEKADGWKLEIRPAAGADLRKSTVWSDEAADAANSLWLIVDAAPPVIEGTEPLEEMLLIDRRKGDVRLEVKATDELSGLQEMKVSICNSDNDAKREWVCGSEGVIRMEITEDEPIFSGDFSIEITACDNVGNEKTLRYDTTEFDLRAEVTRILEPHDPAFARGESGVLHITTWGYAERVEIEFPPEFTACDENLNYTYVYELKQRYRQEEEYVFTIPLNVPENMQYRITVRAYKGEKMLEQYPAFSTIGVSGTVLDEIRTRLR